MTASSTSTASNAAPSGPAATPTATETVPGEATPLDIYRFDLRGYLHLRQAISSDEVAALNAQLDAMPRLKPGQWLGQVHGQQFSPHDGVNYQQIYEGGEPFETLIDHPAWFEKVKTFVGGEGSFDYNHGPLFIDENFASFRGPGEAIGMHSGGHAHSKRNQYRVHRGQFMVGQVNVLLALTDIGPGDGGTVIIPGSHKQNFPHPEMERHQLGGRPHSGDGMPEAVEVQMQKGDALIFTDTICHGSAKRVNEGERRIVVYRYGPSWGFFRHGYRPSRELLNRLTPQRRQIVWPHEPIERRPEDVIDPASVQR